MLSFSWAWADILIDEALSAKLSPLNFSCAFVYYIVLIIRRNRPALVSRIQLVRERRELIGQISSREPFLVDRGDHGLVLLVAVAQVPGRYKIVIIYLIPVSWYGYHSNLNILWNETINHLIAKITHCVMIGLLASMGEQSRRSGMPSISRTWYNKLIICWYYFHWIENKTRMEIRCSQ